jgi:chorismate-pyruvate lyase
VFEEVIEQFAEYFSTQDENNRLLEWTEVRQEIGNVLEKISISPSLQILLSTDGGVTKILEILAKEEVFVETIIQEVTTCSELRSPSLARELNLNYFETINFREVWLRTGENMLVFAISITLFSRLAPDFTHDLTKADIPIGKLLAKYNIESRRDICKIGLKPATAELADAFHLFPNDLVPYRHYNIVKDGKILMKILEFFRPDL